MDPQTLRAKTPGGIAINYLFPVPMFRFQVPIDSLIPLDQRIYELSQQEPSGGGYSSVFTHDDLHEQEPFKAWFAEHLHDRVGEILDELRIVRDEHYLTSAWGNMTWGEFYHPAHMHPNAFLSGIVYLRSPEGAGSTVFEDPKLIARIVEPDISEHTLANTRSFAKTPITGDVLVFPSYLKHSVRPGNAGDELRSTLAFNYHIRGETCRHTQPYVWG